MTKVRIASYNMSYASDFGNLKKYNYASEAPFLASNISCNERKYWENAKLLLIKFLAKEKIPTMIGLQEINKTESAVSGSGAIDHDLQKFFGDKFISVTREVPNGNTKPALTIIYSRELFGEYQFVNYYDPFEEKGRPILLIYTENGYLFVNVHAPPSGPFKNKNHITAAIHKFIDKYSLSKDIKNIFVVGDFNDRYDGIKSFELTNNINLVYKGESPLSCCHEWLSSCPENFNNAIVSYPDSTGTMKDYNQCNIDTHQILDSNNLKLPLPGDFGHVKNYKFKGDKVFGEFPVSEIQMFHGKNGTGASMESDHEMVFAHYETKEKVTGGQRTKRKSTKRKTKKTRKSTKRKTRKSTKRKTRKQSLKKTR